MLTGDLRERLQIDLVRERILCNGTRGSERECEQHDDREESTPHEAFSASSSVTLRRRLRLIAGFT